MATYRERFNDLARHAEEAQSGVRQNMDAIVEEARGAVGQAQQSMDAIVEETRGAVGQAQQNMDAIVEEARGAAGQAQQNMDAIVEEARGAAGQAQQNMDTIVEEARGAVDQARQDMDAIVGETRSKVAAAVSDADTRLSKVIDDALVSKLGAAYDVARQRNQSVANRWYGAGMAALAFSVLGAAVTLAVIPAAASAELWFVVITRLGISAPTAAFAFYAFSVASKHRTKALQDEQYASELTTLLALFDSLDHQQAQVQLGSLKETLLKNYFPGAEREMQLSKRPEGFQVTGKFLATAAGAAIAVILTLSALLAVILAR